MHPTSLSQHLMKTKTHKSKCREFEVRKGTLPDGVVEGVGEGVVLATGGGG